MRRHQLLHLVNFALIAPACIKCRLPLDARTSDGYGRLHLGYVWVAHSDLEDEHRRKHHH
jgi:hypothetical protein